VLLPKGLENRPHHGLHDVNYRRPALIVQPVAVPVRRQPPQPAEPRRVDVVVNPASIAPPLKVEAGPIGRLAIRPQIVALAGSIAKRLRRISSIGTSTPDVSHQVETEHSVQEHERLELGAVLDALVGLDRSEQGQHRWRVQVVGEVRLGLFAVSRRDGP
jgi:hypothetical protein